MTLYQVVADDYDCIPHGNDLFVWANTPEEAINFWRQYYGFVGDMIDDPIRVDEIPIHDLIGPIDWSKVPCVWVAKE